MRMSRAHALLVAFGLTACAKSAPAPNNPESVASTPGSTETCEAAVDTPSVDKSKLDGKLSNELALWRDQVGQARCQDVSSAELEVRKVQVVVDYSGDVEVLRRAGLDTGYDSGNTVSGRIELRRVAALAALNGVRQISMEPAVEPNS